MHILCQYGAAFAKTQRIGAKPGISGSSDMSCAPFKIRGEHIELVELIHTQMTQLSILSLVSTKPSLTVPPGPCWPGSSDNGNLNDYLD
jgi:hypothetical protein